MTPFSMATQASRSGRAALPLPLGTLAGFVVAVVAVVLIAFFSYAALQTRTATAALVARTLEATQQLQTLLSTVKDAETGQRGFLLTDEERYLESYASAQAALGGQFANLRRLAAGNPQQQQRLGTIEQLVAARLDDLGRALALRRAGDTAGVLGLVRTDAGKATMDRLRAAVAEMEREERALLVGRQQDWEDAIEMSTRVAWGGSLVLLLLIGAAAVFTSRDFRAREALGWQRAGQAELSLRVQGEQRLDKLGDAVLQFLAEYLDAQVGALYLAESDGSLRRVAAYALAPDAGHERLRPGDGLLGQAAKEGRALHVRELPEGYLPVASALGRAAPRELLLAPASADGVVQAVIELGFLRRVQPAEAELLARVSELLAVALRSARERIRLAALLEETQRQGEALQTQQEELRVSNEELEEQGRALQESQARMELQQTELEQTNLQLGEQTQRLERQKDALTQAQTVLNSKAIELERVNVYKSEFLANMSHELRTPLNSTLILAKLLADNKSGNLSPEQVKFAQTISSAGNDLLSLINDILDLSKIESGMVEVAPEPVALARTVESLLQALAPVAQQKGLQFGASVDAGTPQQIETDPQRLGQILKNLLSNALKFTERGEVALRVRCEGDAAVAFEVRDTGIGIAPAQQELIFEAFRQADGSTHRKYGGTGLGLSISRDLARVLGGAIAVRSVPGEGSVFTLTLPRVYAPAQAAAPGQAQASAPAHPVAIRIDAAPPDSPPPTPAPAEDDRDRLQPNARLILVIEDDQRFAAILRDLVHEMDFQCVLTHTASDGLAAAATYRPSAILLDINLPDHSGLGVLEQLKRNPLTRHIPVHVASVADYSQGALELGALGYDLKPVQRAQLVKALRRLEAKFSQGLRHVLVVEDDATQRESMVQLLGTGEVEITAVETATEALVQLGARTFDCMVMDLNLPDMSGYELLEKMTAQGHTAFPPVIVYTGRTLTRDEEQKLRRFAKSIIIKDVRSPERLLDEATLFLHQVEATLPAHAQRMLQAARHRDSALEGRRILVVEDDVRNIFALTSVLEPRGAAIVIARNGREALAALERSRTQRDCAIDLVLMDIMMPEMDGFTAMREIRRQPHWKKLPIIALTAKAMKDDQEKCLAAGANDYVAKPLDVEKLLSLVRVWMPK